jgi:hypothetical protein
MIIPTRASSHDSARINCFLIPHPLWKDYSPSDKNSLCYKCNEEIDTPVTADGELFWINKTVPMMNKKYCKIRANINSNIKEEYFGE